MGKASENFLVIKASAGSGKTYRLVLEYLVVAIGADDPGYYRHILAITFTNKAAQEMRERILEVLAQLVKKEEANGMAGKLAARLEMDQARISDRAGAVRKHMLHHYEGLAVMTIDAFVHRLVRRFAKDLQLDQEFTVELDSDRLIEAAVDRVLAQVGQPGYKALTELLANFAQQQIEDERDTRLRHKLIDSARSVTQEQMRGILGLLTEAGWTPTEFVGMHRSLREKIRFFSREVAAEAGRMREAFDREGLVLKDFSRGSMWKWVEKLKLGIELEQAVPSDTLRGQIEACDFAKQKDEVARSKMKRVASEVESLWALYSKTYLGEGGAKLKFEVNLMRRLSLIGTLSLVDLELEAVQADEGVRMFDALNRRVEQIVRENDAPFIFERIGVRYHHLFIDEFQDTSVRQWQNLLPLAHHMLSMGQTVLVVGDAKQSIYRWRNGNFKQLVALPNLLEVETREQREVEAALNRSHRRAELRDNHRSGSAIVNVNNRFFIALSELLPKDLAAVYSDVKQTAMKSFEGAVTMKGLFDAKKEDRKDSRREWLLERVKEHMKDGAFKGSDIAVLVRTGVEAAEMAQVLLEQGIETETDESLKLDKHPSSLGAVALLRWLRSPNDTRAGLRFLQCWCAIENGDEAAILIASSGAMGKLDREKVLSHCCPDVDWVQHQASPMVSLIAFIWEVFGWASKFPAHAEAMLDLAAEARNEKGGGLSGFLHLWDRKGHTYNVRASGSKAIRVMTVHKAKGLAFPVVLLPLQDRTIVKPGRMLPVVLRDSKLPGAVMSLSELKDSPYAEVAEEEEKLALLDGINVVYVAMTRAQERLDVLMEFSTELKNDVGQSTRLNHFFHHAALEAFGKSLFEGESYAQGDGSRPGRTDDGEKPGEVTDTRRGLALRAHDQDTVAVPAPVTGWSQASRMSASAFGEAVHRVLASIGSMEDWPEIRRRLGAGLRMDAADLQTVIDRVEAVLSHPKIAEWFVSGLTIWVERGIAWEGKVLRPDRVVERGTGRTVIDFKTGKQKPQDLSQVRQYAQAVSASQGPDIEAYLVYLEGSTEGVSVEVVEVSW